MGTQVNIIILFICFLFVCLNGVEGDKFELSKEEHLEIDGQLKLLTKPANKTLVSKDGDIYDCVDFDKQPAFDNPKTNRKTDLQVPPSLPKTLTKRKQTIVKHASIGFEGEGCPFRTVPLKRVTKGDLIREKIASKIRSTANEGNRPYAAVVRTAYSFSSYMGATAQISIHNPQVSDGQYSAARIKIGNGFNSIEAGWRVDPTLHEDNKTRLYLRTDVNETRCFNTECPGFVIVSEQWVLGNTFHNISGPRDVYGYKVSILQDTENANWNLYFGDDNVFVGYWPASLFDLDKVGGIFAQYMEWGGEVYGPGGSIAPQMGAGHSVVTDANYDALFNEITALGSDGKLIDEHIHYLEERTDRNEYQIVDGGYISDYLKRLVYYGGPGGFVI